MQKFIAFVAVAGLASQWIGGGAASAHEFPPYPEQKPLAAERQGVVAKGRENTPNGGRPEINSA